MKSPNLIRTTALVVAATGLLWIPRGALADELRLRDGSVLKGTVVSVTDGKLVFDTEFSDTIDVELEAIEAITTDEPVDVVLSAGTLVRGPISTLDDGSMVVTADGQQHPVSLAEIVGIFQLPPRWNNDLTLGGSLTDGNSEVLGFQASYKTTFTSEHDRVTGKFKFTYAEAEGEAVAKNSSAQAKYDRFLTPRWFLHLVGEFRYDQFAGLDLRAPVTFGMGYVLFATPAAILEVEGGAGVMFEEFAVEGREDRATARFAANLRLPIADRAVVTNDFTVFPGLSDDPPVQIVEDLTLEMQLIGNWGLKLSLTINYDSDPSVVAVQPDDYQFTVGVDYSF